MTVSSHVVIVRHTSKCKLYRAWWGMKKCTGFHRAWLADPNSKYYAGVSLCEEWRNDFMAFCRWSLENGFDKGKTLRRIDKRGDFCPENCHWIMNMQKPRWLKRQENAERRAAAEAAQNRKEVRHG